MWNYVQTCLSQHFSTSWSAQNETRRDSQQHDIILIRSLNEICWDTLAHVDCPQTRNFINASSIRVTVGSYMEGRFFTSVDGPTSRNCIKRWKWTDRPQTGQIVVPNLYTIQSTLHSTAHCNNKPQPDTEQNLSLASYSVTWNQAANQWPTSNNARSTVSAREQTAPKCIWACSIFQRG